MAVLVGNETYTRFVFDPEEGEMKFVVSNEGEEKIVSGDELEAAIEPEGAKIERLVIVPNEDARKIMVTFRPLRAYDKHAIQDLTTDVGASQMGQSRRLLIRRAVQKWDYDTPWTESILDQLDSGLEEQIYGWVSWGVAPLEQDPETGQPIPLEEPTLNRKQKREQAKGSSSLKTKDEPVSPEANEDDSTS